MPHFDTLIQHAKVVDGTGNPWFWGDVALSGDRIAAVTLAGQLPTDNAREVVDARGQVVCPGFIDIQSHSIIPLMKDPKCLSKIMQGVTTEIMGEQWSPGPVGGRFTEPLTGGIIAPGPEIAQWVDQAKGWRRFGDWLDAFVARGVSPNVGSFVGGGTIRQYGKGMDMGPATPEEIKVMRRAMAESMADGAFGVAYALIYPPDAFVAADEIVQVCEVVGQYGGVYITHMRSEGDGIFEALEETIQIGQRANCAVEIYHLKAAGRKNWHKMPSVIARIEAARADGLDVTADMYPYVGSGTGLASVFPPTLAEGGKLFERLRDPNQREAIRRAALTPSRDWENIGEQSGGGPGVMPVALTHPDLRGYIGQRLDAIAAARGQDWAEAAIDLLTTQNENIFTIYFTMREENLRLQLQQPWVKVSTDAGGVDPAWAIANGPLHPRAYGTYPRVLAKYVREEGLLTLEDAIRKMSGAVADRLSLRERGVLRAGCFADVVCFDPNTVTDRSTFDNTHQLAVGINEVWVNGARVVKAGQHTGATPGRFVKGPGAA